MIVLDPCTNPLREIGVGPRPNHLLLRQRKVGALPQTLPGAAPLRAKREVPIDRHRSPTGSCSGGFRTPDGIRKPSPCMPFVPA